MRPQQSPANVGKSGPARARVSGRQLVENFAPSWFAAVMGSGVLALGAGFLGHRYAPLAGVAAALHWFNVALFLLLLPWTLRW